MSSAFQLGPLLLPFTLVLIVASATVSAALGHRFGRRAGVEVDVDAVLWRALLVGVIVARLAFVFEYRTLYLSAPLGIVDIRDGGWNPTAGLVAAWFYAIHRQRGSPALARPVNWALVVGTILFVIGSSALSLRLDTDRKLPELSFETLDRRSASLAQFAGKPTVVNLWATWCGPCAREMPMLRLAQDERADVNFIFLNQGESRAEVERWLSQHELPLRNVLLDETRRASAAFQQKGYPTTLFFDGKGRLAAMRLGELSPATLAEKLQDIKP